jgi:hypothetical protein
VFLLDCLNSLKSAFIIQEKNMKTETETLVSIETEHRYQFITTNFTDSVLHLNRMTSISKTLTDSVFARLFEQLKQSFHHSREKYENRNRNIGINRNRTSESIKNIDRNE